MIPESTKRQIEDFVNQGTPPGSFVEAVLCNNLIRAFQYADEENIHFMFDTVKYLYNNVPVGCYGSETKIASWIKEKNDDNVCNLSEA